MIKKILLITLLIFSGRIFCQTPTLPPNHSLIFEVVQDEFVLDKETIKSAAIIENQGVYQGLNIELKPQAATIFTEITKAGRGRKMNLVFNHVVLTTVVLQTELTGNFLISGISKQDAQTFLNVLNQNKKA